MILLLASHNATKRAGLARALTKAGVHTVGADALGLAEPEETGTRFVDNATIKALAAAQASGMVALADDSGFVMPVLDGGPGVYTADWSYTATGRDWVQAMDRIHDEVVARGAHFPALSAFVACLVLARPDGQTRVFTREQGGHAVWPPRPGVGFALDPIFVPFGAHLALSEMDAYDAAAYDHRARAAQDVADWLSTPEGQAFADLGQRSTQPVSIEAAA
jgi:XTP/dITP diphosphohydrolase